MPPRRSASAAQLEDGSNPSEASTSKRRLRSQGSRPVADTPDSGSLPPQEDDHMAFAEVVVPNTPKNARSKHADATRQAVIPATASSTTGTPRSLRSSRHTSSIAQAESVTDSPSGRGVPVKKQDFPTAIAADDDGKPDDLSDQASTEKQKANPKPTKRVLIRKSRSKWDNPDEMLTAQNAPLAEADLRDLLCNPGAWDGLSSEEKEKILAKFPDNAEVLDPDTPEARPNIAALRSNDDFRHDIARYKEGLSKGFHDAEWIQQAQAAHRLRKLGSYEEFMAEDFEEKWGLPMPQQLHAEAATSGNGSHGAGCVPGGEVMVKSADSDSMAQSKGMPGQRQGTDGTSRL
ncbi:Asx homology domain-containing protein [Astrocystis sublimbata]|nr:Asx homology domain-containing protein [Astrocystis sublimbata]